MGQVVHCVILCLIHFLAMDSVSLTPTTEGLTTTSANHLHNVSSDYHDEYDEDEEETISSYYVGAVPKSVYLFFIYFILIFGIIGNACVFILMWYKSFRSNSYSVYLRFLAVTDSFYLISTCIEDILDHHFRLLYDTIYTSGNVLCKGWTYFLTFGPLISPWLLTAFTWDRYVAIIFPFQRKIFTTVRTALIISCIILLLIGGETIVFPASTVYTSPDQENCQLVSSKVLGNYYRIRLLVLESSLPCALILYFNIHVIHGVRKSYQFRKAAVEKEREKMSDENRITLSLVTVSLMAFFTLTPMAIILVLEAIWQDDYEDLEKSSAPFTNATRDELSALEIHLNNITDVWPIFNLIKLLNFGQNFYVMIVTGRKYRQTFLGMLGLTRHKESKQESSVNTGTHVQSQLTELKIFTTIRESSAEE